MLKDKTSNSLEFQKPKGNKGAIYELANKVLHSIDVIDPNTQELTTIMKSNLSRMIKEMGVLYELNKRIRTKKKFVEGVGHYPLSKVLYDRRSGKIKDFNELYKVISVPHFLKVIKKVSGESFNIALNNYREKLCQQKK